MATGNARFHNYMPWPSEANCLNLSDFWPYPQTLMDLEPRLSISPVGTTSPTPSPNCKIDAVNIVRYIDKITACYDAGHEGACATSHVKVRAATLATCGVVIAHLVHRWLISVCSQLVNACTR